ncbi:uncharacterized protein LOC123507130 isoform X5 [Portunus trituberculatus]|uniref:uncharacterized protein LOC123507130 isoform X5 n=1 Tax=Portunus trituberculatus TaxID=210409 RepID=UPI001E1D0F8A|nr:uncharacterized protein LOC123507130 isoform X5 [Portunus trituberculatus]
MPGNNKVPDRWEKYTSMGRIIPGTRFISFKVPLRQEIMQKVKNAEWFCPRTVMDHCHNLGLVIDLTDTFRYYHPEDFESRGVTHCKIRVRGKLIPEEKAVQKFFQAVNKFLEKNKENDKVIGVHCTHGINRSGYLVCRYMIQVLGIPPDQAIADFNSARGHEQERENYLADLRQAPWMDEAVVRFSRSNSKASNASEYSTNPLDASTASSLDTTLNSTLDTTNNTSLDTTASEVESPGGSMGVASGRSWNIPLMKYPRPQAKGDAGRHVPHPARQRACRQDPPVVCFRCHQEGHIAKFCRNPRIRSKKASKEQSAPLSASDVPQNKSPGQPQSNVTPRTPAPGGDSYRTGNQSAQSPTAATQGDPPKMDSPEHKPQPSVPGLEEDLLSSLSLG